MRNPGFIEISGLPHRDITAFVIPDVLTTAGFGMICGNRE
jgi:hypothetical protein